MAKIIVTSRYLKSGKRGKTKRRNYTKYIATRESVEKRPQNTGKTTDNQKQLISELIKEFPMAKQLLEYADYVAKPTVENASELISTIIERHADVIGNRRNFVGYMAKRSGAEQRGEHGLFTDSDDPIDLNAVANEVAEHPGYVWTHVVSLHREDAIRLGYTNSDMWRDLVMRHIQDIANAQKIETANLKWYAAFHDTTHHPHIHLIVYSKDPRQGYLTKDGIDKIRSVFANDIFHDDLQSIYQVQTLSRNELKALSENNMKEIIAQLGSGSVDEKLVNSIQKLHEQLQTTRGKKVYGYLPKDVKLTVDDIFLLLSKDESIQKLYDKWCEFEKAKYKMYTQKHKEFPALVDNKEFNSVRNMIIRTVMKIDNSLSEAELPEITESDDNDDDVHPADDYGEQVLPEDVESADTDIADNTSSTSKYTLKWSKEYKVAREILYDKESDIQKYHEAEKMLLSEPYNALALYELGKLYSSDKLGEKDDDKSDKNYAEALKAFLEIEPSAGSMFPFESKYKDPQPADMCSYVWYRTGKMYYYGLGTEQNYSEAFKWLEKAASEGNKFAQFSLGSMYYYGNGVEQSNKDAFEWYQKSADQGQPYASYAVAQMYSKGEYVAYDNETANAYYMKALAGFQSLDSKGQADERILYKIGRMHMKGLGTEINIQKAIPYLLRATQLDEKNAKRIIAQEYIKGVNMSADIENGVKMLTELADDGDNISAYKLGKMYMNGGVIFKNLNKAEKYLNQASVDNEYAMYALAKLYLSNQKYSLENAVLLLDRACHYEGVKPYAAYLYAKILLDNNCFHDTEKAVQILKGTAYKNSWCSYLLGKLYLFGSDDIERDTAEAVKWLTMSTESGNEYAQRLLENADNYHSAMLTSTVASLMINIGRIIEEDNRRSRKNISRTDRKLMRIIQRKKEGLGIKSDGAEMYYEY